MIDLVYISNPLKPTERRLERLIPMTFEHWIGLHFPNGVIRGTLTVVVNGDKIKDTEGLSFKDGDVVLIVRTPAGTELLGYVLQALVSLAIGYVLSQIFAPKKPSAIVDQPSASPVYSITGSQNAARLGEPIPVGYGSFIQVPDFGSQPYTEFVNHEMYLNEILVIGQGQYRIEEMFVGESSVAGIADGIVQWSTFTAADHLQRMGQIEDSTGILENVVTSPEVGDQELTAGTPITVPPTRYWKAISEAYTLGEGSPPNETICPGGGVAPNDYYWLIDNFDTETLGTIYSYCSANFGSEAGTFFTWVDIELVEYSPPPWPPLSVVPPSTVITPDPGDSAVGWFELCKPGQRGNKVMLDFVFAAGLYTSNASTGALEPKGVELKIDIQRISDSGDPISPMISENVIYVESTNNARRYTHVIEGFPPSRYRARVTRLTANAADNLTVDKVVWTGLKFNLVRTPASQTIYGDTMLVAVRIKATNGIASAATSRIRFRVTRMLPVLGSGPALPTVSPADAVVDVMTAVYGAARPLTECDIAALTLCRAAWSLHNGFNGVFAQRSTVFEALSTILQPVAAGPLPVGQVMSVQVDSVKDTRVAMFNEANLRELQIGYEFDRVGRPVGSRVEYRRDDSFDPDFVVLPANELDVEQVSLFGCTDRTTAAQYAQLMQNRRSVQRKTISFDTELEGLLLLPGDRFAVQHHMPDWGQVGIVEEVSGTTVTLDRYLDWSVPGPYGVLLSDEENGVSGVILVTQGAAANIIELASVPFTLFGRGEGQEPTRVSFGTIDNIVRDWIVVDATPNGENATHVEAIIYDPAVYIGAMPHQLFDPATGSGTPPFDLIVAGRPGSPSDGLIGAGRPATIAVDIISGGEPNDH